MPLFGESSLRQSEIETGDGKTMPLFDNDVREKESPEVEKSKPKLMRGDDIVLQQSIPYAVALSGGTMEIIVEDKKYQVEIPAQTTEGEILVIEGAGEAGTNGGEPGDIKICIHILKENKQKTEDKGKKRDKSGLDYLDEMHVTDEYIRTQRVTLEERKDGKKNLLKIAIALLTSSIVMLVSTGGISIILTVVAVGMMIHCGVTISGCNKQIEYLKKEQENEARSSDGKMN